MSHDKPRWPYERAMEVATSLAALLMFTTARLEIAGSLRRRKREVGDIELLYVPRMEMRTDAASLIGDKLVVNTADEEIARLERTGVLARRKNVNGREAFGEKNKLMLHAPSGIPVDLFAATEENWFNYLVCRTGGAENNVAIASAALRKGWKWHPYGAGFSRKRYFETDDIKLPDLMHVVTSEEDVFQFVGLPYRKPMDRR